MPGTLDRWFRLQEHGTDAATEVRAIVLGYVGVPGLDGKGLPFAATLTVTCLTAGLLSIAMLSRKEPTS